MVRIMYGQALANLGAGGAIISNRHILTTAFIMGQNFQQIQIFSSSSFRGLQTPLAVQGRVPHPAYQPNPRLNDIGIFRVVNDIVFSALMQPIRLPSRALPYESEQGIALGFGGSPVAAPNNAGLYIFFLEHSMFNKKLIKQIFLLPSCALFQLLAATNASNFILLPLSSALKMPE